MRSKECLCCGKILNKIVKTYCNNECQQEYKSREYIREWKQGVRTGSEPSGGISTTIRKYIIEKYGNKCAKCGWCEINPKTKKVPVTIDHIDGNWRNNTEENLILLCPNCHSLTSTYGSLNKGNGRGLERYGPRFREMLVRYKFDSTA